MKSIRAIGICLLLMNVSLVNAQNWTKTVNNDSRYIRSNGIISVEDGFTGYGIIDTSHAFYFGGSGGYSGILFALDSNGDSLWFHEYSLDSSLSIWFEDMTLLPSKEYVAIGRNSMLDSTGVVYNSTGIWVIDSLGNLISERNIDWLWLSYPSIISTTDSGYAIIGKCSDCASNNSHYINLVKFDNNHQIEWISALGAIDPDWQYSGSRFRLAINPVNDNYLVGFNRVNLNTFNYDPGILELDSEGDSVKVISFGDPRESYLLHLESSGNSIYGVTLEFDIGGTDDSLCLVKLDGQLDTIWFDRTSGANVGCWGPKSYEGFIMARDSLLYTYDSNGDTTLIWDSTAISGVIEYSTGSYLSWSNQQDQIRIMNFNDPHLEEGYELEQEGFTLFPNPANEFIEVSIDEGRFRLNDIQGRFILEDVFSDHKIDLKEVPRGLYILSIEIGDGSYTTQRLIKL